VYRIQAVPNRQEDDMATKEVLWARGKGEIVGPDTNKRQWRCALPYIFNVVAQLVNNCKPFARISSCQEPTDM
jgi:hypothetical protein